MQVSGDAKVPSLEIGGRFQNFWRISLDYRVVDACAYKNNVVDLCGYQGEDQLQAGFWRKPVELILGEGRA